MKTANGKNASIHDKQNFDIFISQTQIITSSTQWYSKRQNIKLTTAQYSNCITVYNDRRCESWPSWQVDSYDTDTDTSFMSAHWCSESPPISLWVVTLDSIQIWWTVITTDCIQLATTGCQSHTAAFDIHWWNSSPLVSSWIIALNRAQEHVAIVTASYVHSAVECSNSKSTSLWQHWCSNCPDTSNTVIDLHLLLVSAIQTQQSTNQTHQILLFNTVYQRDVKFSACREKNTGQAIC